MTTELMEKLNRSASAGPIGTEAEARSASAHSAPAIHTPFADLMLKPEKLAAAFNQIGGESAKAKSPGTKSRKTHRAEASSKSGLRDTEFRFEAPGASSVKLAADFTGWEKAQLDLVQKSNGVWSVIVPLAPGRHHYRFIVDGIWCDDPQCSEFIPNSFGTANSVKEISL